MIIITQNGWDWDELYEYGPQQTSDIIEQVHTRLSEVLGPDGEQLVILKARPRIGFDLSRKD